MCTRTKRALCARTALPNHIAEIALRQIYYGRHITADALLQINYERGRKPTWHQTACMAKMENERLQRCYY